MIKSMLNYTIYAFAVASFLVTGCAQQQPWAEDAAAVAPLVPTTIEPSHCGQCHMREHSQWLRSVKAQSAKNPLFLTFYAMAKSDLGEEGAKDCLTCHVPSVPTLQVVSPGIDCEVCHRVLDVHEAENGRYKSEWVRGPIVTGPKSDKVARHRYIGRDIFRSAKLCAPCHAGAHRKPGMDGFSTYDVWAKSWHATQGTTCQACHMEKRAATVNANHVFVGGANLLWMRESFSIEMKKEGDTTQLILGNAAAAHNIPGGAIDLREFRVTAFWLDESENIIDETRVVTLGPAYFDSERRAVPYWRAEIAEPKATPVDKPVPYDIDPPPEAKLVRFDLTYFNVTPGLKWLFKGKRFPGNPPVIVGTRTFDLTTGEVIGESEDTDDW